MSTRPGIERFAIATVVSGCACLVSYVGLRGVGLPILFAVPLVVLAGVAVVLWLSRQLPPELDGIRKRKLWLSAAWLLLGLVALVQTARLSVFMLDHTQVQYSLFPEDQWMVDHCCLTAYSESARFTGEGEPNVYNQELYSNRKLDSFNVDLYHYPPTFLLLPLGVRAIVGGDFESMRAVWFGASALALMLAMGLIAYRLEPEGRLRAIGMAPLIWCSMPVLAGLQMSNVQILVVAISAIALAALPRQAAVGGMLLAMSAVAKIFPGILFVYLVARRKWRAVAWTAGCAIFLTVVALIIVGPGQFQSFIEYELPRLSSGEAFCRPFSREFAVARNMSPFGIPLKLASLNVPGMTLGTGRIVSMVYLMGVVGLSIWAGRRRPRSSTEAASVWLSLLSLGTLVSPFAPANYVLTSLVWLVCFNREIFRPVTAVVIWLLISAPFLIPRESPFLLQAICYLPAQMLAVGVPVFVLWRAGMKRSHEQSQESTIVPALA